MGLAMSRVNGGESVKWRRARRRTRRAARPSSRTSSAAAWSTRCYLAASDKPSRGPCRQDLSGTRWRKASKITTLPLLLLPNGQRIGQRNENGRFNGTGGARDPLAPRAAEQGLVEGLGA